MGVQGFHFNRKCPAARLYSRIEKDSSGCWNYTGQRCPQGYGKLKCVDYGETLAHRVSYIVHHGPIKKEDCVLHRCDNPSCVNPEHLFLGDRDVNNKDRAKKGRTVTPNMNLTHCKRGHEFTVENTTIRKNGTRLCRTCVNSQSARRYHERKNNVSLK